MGNAHCGLAGVAIVCILVMISRVSHGIRSRACHQQRQALISGLHPRSSPLLGTRRAFTAGLGAGTSPNIAGDCFGGDRRRDIKLVKLLTAPPAHQKTEQWIVFSDLHVKASSIDTCEDVLARIHDEAVSRSAGIIFLGDFWHVRGVLNVDLLNRVLRSLKKWTVPVVMIPGNHDQVTLGGTVHALEPLLYAFPPDQALLISEPSLCLNALWLPYRRDHKLMASIIGEVRGREDMSIVFCHADVRGAFMNDGIRSKEGLDVDVFPVGVPIFSGHFHKPHTVTKNGVQLRYVGSPYQTSLSEADQEKYLYLLSCKPSTDCSLATWREEERWPISYGRKHFRALGVNDAKISAARPGDRVVLSVSSDDANKADTLAENLRNQGIEVEVRAEKVEFTKPSSHESLQEDPGAFALATQAGESNANVTKLFQTYVTSLTADSFQKQQSDKSSSVDEGQWEERKRALLAKGVPLLENLIDSIPSLHRLRVAGSALETKDLVLKKIMLKNFGPYGGAPVTYPLDKRGLVLIQGRVEDETGADSNGSGKTTLAMSIMWCLTGSLDARLIADARSADVAFDASTVGEAAKAKAGAEVTLQGFINGQPFEVTRRKSSRKSELLFSMGGKDLTTLGIKETQVLIEETLGTGNGLLQRCCFYGQHSHTQQSLLGLQDARLKDELSKLVDVTVWAAAARDARSKEKDCHDKLQELAFNTKIRTGELASAKVAVRSAEEALSRVDREAERVAGLGLDSTKLVETSSACDEVERQVQQAQLAIDEHKSFVQPLRVQLVDHLERSSDNGSRRESLLDLEVKAGQQRVLLVTQKKSRAQWQERLRMVVDEIARLEELAVAQVEGIEVDDNGRRSDDWAASLQRMRSGAEEATKRMGALDSQIDGRNSTFVQLRALCDRRHNPAHIADHCPTCGQDMPEEDRVQRMETVGMELRELLVRRRALHGELTAAKEVVLRLQGALVLADQLAPLRRQREELERECQQMDDSIERTSGLLQTLESSVRLQEAETARAALRSSEQKAELNSRLLSHEDALCVAEKELKLLQARLEVLRKQKILLSKQKTDEAYTRGLHENKRSYAQRVLAEKRLVEQRLEEQLSEFAQQKSLLMDQAVVHSQLASLFGPRGIQNFLFGGALRDLEAASNAYLAVLAEGGMELALRSDDDGEKILKTVLMKMRDDSGQPAMSERALSLLSGGQWRRASLALDLAFTDMVRRKGLLRCNVLVMDEVLSHLDGQGREAVGSVLRALVAPSPTARSGMGALRLDDVLVEDTQAADPASSLVEKERAQQLARLEMDRYETILVILQDVVAAEMEESFDHIDQVVRTGAVSTVNIDGGEM